MYYSTGASTVLSIWGHDLGTFYMYIPAMPGVTVTKRPRHFLFYATFYSPHALFKYKGPADVKW